MEVNLPFLLCFTLYLRAISKYKLLGGLYLEELFNGRLFALPVRGSYISRGLYMEGLIFGILQYVGSSLQEGSPAFHKVERETPRPALGICGFHQSYFETNQTLNQFNRSVLLRDNSTFIVTIFYIVYMEAVAPEFDDVSNVSLPFNREDKCDVTLLR